MRERFPRRAGVATLTDRRSLTPRMLRVTMRSEDFGPDWPIQQPGEILTLLFPPPGEPIVLPTAGWVFPADAPRQEWRNYTVRRHRREPGEIDVDVVLHEPAGPACAGAAAAPIGAAVGYAGPRVDFQPRAGAEWLLLCGDETALPAIAAILETPGLPPHVLAVVEVRDAHERLPLHLPGGGFVRWVERGDVPAGTSAGLADALRELSLPDAAGQVWGAAESHVARDLRAVLRDERGLPRAHVSVKGYWLRAGDWLDDAA